MRNSKNEWRAYAEFIRTDEDCFRISTELRFGEGSAKLLGTVVMINPGSSRPSTDKEGMQPATLDRTMRFVCSVVDDAYKLSGKILPGGGFVRIANLFDLCDPDYSRAVSRSCKLTQADNENNLLCRSLANLPPKSPWFWLAWGKGGENEWLDNQRHTALKSIDVRKVVGCKVPTNDFGYYHPGYLSRQNRQKPELRQSLVEQIAARTV